MLLMTLHLDNYRPHPKDGEGTVLTGVCPHPGGTQFPSHNTSTGPMSFLEWGYPSDWSQVPLGEGVSQTGGNLVQCRELVPQSKADSTPGQDWGSPTPSRTGLGSPRPPPRD